MEPSIPCSRTSAVCATILLGLGLGLGDCRINRSLVINRSSITDGQCVSEKTDCVMAFSIVVI